jgi:aryl-alcohol dehydrogenase-like predicted oxidoreductase
MNGWWAVRRVLPADIAAVGSCLKNRSCPMSDRLSRRRFLHTGAVAAGAAAAALAPAYTVHAGNPEKADVGKIVNYSADMEYRRCGRTGLMVSAVCLGGHWKRLDTVISTLTKGAAWGMVDVANPAFQKNRAEIVSRCIDRGFNYIDACTGGEVMAYAKALQGRREKMYLGFSWAEGEIRNPECRTCEKLKQTMDQGLKQAGLEYVDLWRITCLEQSGQHDARTMEEMAKALEWAKKSGRARFTGISSHDRPHIRKLIETYPQQIEIVVTPYTAKTKVVEDQHGLWAAMQKHGVGWFGIKPFASNSVFKGTSAPGDPHADEDNRIARLALRYILCNPAITAPIPGLITVDQVDNAALAIKERRELDAGEKAELEEAMDRAWAGLPYHYQWLKDWEYV